MNKVVKKKRPLRGAAKIRHDNKSKGREYPTLTWKEYNELKRIPPEVGYENKRRSKT